MRLEVRYRIRFTYPEDWMVALEGGWEQHLFIADGRREGAISGRFRGANFPHRRGPTGPYTPNFRSSRRMTAPRSCGSVMGTAGPIRRAGVRSSARCSTSAIATDTSS